MQSDKQLIPILEQYVQRKSALSRKQLVKLSLCAYKRLRYDMKLFNVVIPTHTPFTKYDIWIYVRKKK